MVDGDDDGVAHAAAAAGQAVAQPAGESPVDELDDGASIESRALRSAIEFAVSFAAAGRRARPPIPSPSELRRHAATPRISNAALGRIRREVESDVAFRRRLTAAATPDLVDEIGRMWLDGRAGWPVAAQEILDRHDAERHEQEAGAMAHRAEKRRVAAESAAARSRVEIVALQEQLRAARAELANLEQARSEDAAAIERATNDAAGARREGRQSRDRLRSATARMGELEATVAAERTRAANAEAERDRLLLARTISAGGPPITATTLDELRRFATETRRVADGLARLVDPPHATRSPTPIPGAARRDDAATAEFLLRQPDVLVVIDGYNVAKLQVADELGRQREQLLNRLDDMVRRWHVDVDVVFDGNAVVGAHSPVRRLVRVEFTPEGTSADDMIRGIVRTTPVSRAVVVVTDDKEIRRDVAAEGADLVHSRTLLALIS